MLLRSRPRPGNKTTREVLASIRGREPVLSEQVFTIVLVENSKFRTRSLWQVLYTENSHLRAALIGRLYRRRLNLARLSVPTAKMPGLLHRPLPLPELRRRVVKHPARSPMPIPALEHFRAFEALDLDGHLLHLPIDEHSNSELVRHSVRGIALGRPVCCQWCGWIAA